MTKNILIVDDEPAVGFSLKASLESLGPEYAVSHVLSAEAALSVLADDPIDLMVTDLRMPGMTGLELLTQVRHVQPQLPTILITAYGSADVMAAGQQLQIARYFAKPFKTEEFMQAVQEVLEQPPAGLVLTEKKMERMVQRLRDLRYEASAYSVLLADTSGSVLAKTGATDGFEAAELIELLRGGFDAPTALAQQWHEERAFNLIYHEGVRFDLYAANIDPRLFVVMVFDRRQGPTRIGVVWLYLKRAVLDLQNVLVRADDSVLPAASGAATR
ncbi:MAG: response regulator [Chloroflexi bacterium]|nr:response regulator [Chloroflexota bacterium]